MHISMFIIKQYVHNYTEQTYNTIYICIVLAQKHIQKTGLYSCYIYIHCIHINPTVARGFFRPGITSGKAGAPDLLL